MKPRKPKFAVGQVVALLDGQDVGIVSTVRHLPSGNVEYKLACGSTFMCESWWGEWALRPLTRKERGPRRQGRKKR